MEQLELEKLQERLLKEIDGCSDCEKQTKLYQQLTGVLQRLQIIYKQQIENLKRQIK